MKHKCLSDLCTHTEAHMTLLVFQESDYKIKKMKLLSNTLKNSEVFTKSIQNKSLDELEEIMTELYYYCTLLLKIIATRQLTSMFKEFHGI